MTISLVAASFAAQASAYAAGTPVVIKNTTSGALGVFDPSLAKDVTRNLVWMSYTAVDHSIQWPSQNNLVESIRLAFSADGGKTWTDVGQPISAFQDVTISGSPPGTAGTWVNEVSQLIYDPGATTAERYKVMWQHYLVINGQRQFQDSWLAIKTADVPEHLPAAAERKVFSGFAYNSNVNWTPGNLHSPMAGTPMVSLDRIAPALNSCVFTEPGMIATQSALYLSVSCNHLMNGDQLVVLMKCGAPCQPSSSATNWTYVATLFNKAKAPAGFDDGVTGSSLFQGSNGAYYISVTPSKTSGAPWPDFYTGCQIYKFTDITHGTLAPTPVAKVSGTNGSFNGACAYNASNKSGGMFYDQLSLGTAKPFQIYSSGVNF